MQAFGGISRYFVELANNISSTPGVSVGVISPLYINAYLADSSNRVRVMGQRVPEVRRTGRIYRTINNLLTPLWMRHFQPDLVHETYYSRCRLAPKGTKLVLTVHDMIHERFSESFPPGDATSIDKRRAVERADHVICISEQTRKDLLDRVDIDPGKTSVVHHGFSLTKQPMSVGPRSGRPYLLYVGNRGGYKNFESLLQAYAAEPLMQREYDLVAFGGGPFNAQELALMHAHGLDERQLRQIAGNDAVLADLYQHAALFVYPSRYEGFGIPPLEAMSFDCPVVCSNVSSIPEVVGDAAEFFNPDSSVELGKAIERVLNNAVLRQALISRGRERIKLFSWERCAHQTLDIYRRLLP